MKKKYGILVIGMIVFMFVLSVSTIGAHGWEKEQRGFHMTNDNPACVKTNCPQPCMGEKQSKYKDMEGASKRSQCVRENSRTQLNGKKCEKQLKNQQQSCYNRESEKKATE